MACVVLMMASPFQHKRQNQESSLGSPIMMAAGLSKEVKELSSVLGRNMGCWGKATISGYLREKWLNLRSRRLSILGAVKEIKLVTVLITRGRRLRPSHPETIFDNILFKERGPTRIIKLSFVLVIIINILNANINYL